MLTDEGQVYRLERGNKGGTCISCGEVGHMVRSCPRNAWSKKRKNEFKGKEWVGVGRARGKCFGTLFMSSNKKRFSNTYKQG